MIPARTGKSVAKRIDIRYITRRHALRRWKLIAALAAAGAAAAWLAYAAIRGDNRIYAAGPVSKAHASIENDCASCHEESWQPVRRLLLLDSRIRSIADTTCSNVKCHEVPAHQAEEKKEKVPACANCHREHRGLPSLSQVADLFCVSCHSDLKTAAASPRFAERVTSFERDHPEFAVKRDDWSDKAQIKLNHELHLRADGLRGADGERTTLACGDCHQPDAERKYMLPVTYQQHCKTCHPLLFDLASFGTTPVPHDAPQAIRDFLVARYQEPPTPRAATQPGGDVPRRLPGKSDADRDAARVARTNERVARVELLLYQDAAGCKLCHELDSPTSGLPEIKPTKIPPRWMIYSRFSHLKHRAMKCDDCHLAHSSKDTTEVLMPAVDLCRRCHSDSGGARTDCVECHQYHHGGRTTPAQSAN